MNVVTVMRSMVVYGRIGNPNIAVCGCGYPLAQIVLHYINFADYRTVIKCTGHLRAIIIIYPCSKLPIVDGVRIEISAYIVAKYFGKLGGRLIVLLRLKNGSLLYGNGVRLSVALRQI